MKLDIGHHSGKEYTVTTPLYEGPLDLLLQLIERAELDITKLALAQVTDQFLNYINEMPESDADEVSAFLVIAAKLIQIKSEFLLPRKVCRQHTRKDFPKSQGFRPQQKGYSLQKNWDRL